MPDCYVYYRIDAAREAAARTALAAMLADLQATTGVRGSVYRKEHEPLLWMEVYTGVTDGDALIDTLAQLADQHGLTSCIADHERRHVERFVAFE